MENKKQILKHIKKEISISKKQLDFYIGISKKDERFEKMVMYWKGRVDGLENTLSIMTEDLTVDEIVMEVLKEWI